VILKPIPSVFVQFIDTGCDGGRQGHNKAELRIWMNMPRPLKRHVSRALEFRTTTSKFPQIEETFLSIYATTVSASSPSQTTTPKRRRISISLRPHILFIHNGTRTDSGKPDRTALLLRPQFVLRSRAGFSTVRLRRTQRGHEENSRLRFFVFRRHVGS
jgi:hypothetical protein